MDHVSGFQRIALAVLVSMAGVRGASAQVLSVNGAAAASANVATDTGESESTRKSSMAAPPAKVASVPEQRSSVLTDEENRQAAAGNVAEVKKMIGNSELSELRTTYNGSYGASQLYYAKEMTYYIVLFQQKQFWRVIKTQDDIRADLIYRDFVSQTEELSSDEIRREKLDAQKTFTERMVALSKDQANRLQADLDVARRQQAIVNGQQKLRREQTTALQAQKTADQQLLRTSQQQVNELQQQLETGLPVSH
jgi:hypothetical protein